MNNVTTEAEARQPRLRRANECIADAGHACTPEYLFDEYWREGEIALFFGPVGSGKSVLSMQIAEAMARGSEIGEFRMPEKSRKVLYVDLVLRDAQFRARYTFVPESGKPKVYKFSEKLYRERPQKNEDLIEWLRVVVPADGIQVVIIDDISVFRRTCDGTLDTLRTMRQLRELRDELGISMLVLTDAAEPGRREKASEADLGRSRVLCGAADSVFAIERTQPYDPEDSDSELSLVQTRVRSAPVHWHHENAPTFCLERAETGMIAMNFDDWSGEAMDPKKRELICRIGALRNSGATYRMIAEALGISKSQAARLDKKWTQKLADVEEAAVKSRAAAAERIAAMKEWDKRQASGNDYRELDDDEECDDEECDDDEEYEEDDGAEAVETPAREMNVHAIPFAAGLGRRSVYDLKSGLDGYGRPIYIESEDEHNGKPIVWYQFDDKGNKSRYQRGLFAVQKQHLGPGPFL